MENLKLSYYTIPVKLEDEENKYLLVHGYTGAIDIVDGDIWKEMENYSAASNLSAETIQLLQKRGYLTMKTKEEEHIYVAKIANLLHEAHKRLFKSFSFLITYNCNFRCPYCFENGISSNGSAWSGQVLSREMVDKAYSAMLNIEPRQELHSKNILLYGGEPLLKENKDVVCYIVYKGHQLGYKFNVITNGYDLDSYDDLLSPDLFNMLQITLDGWKEYHDSRRKHYLGIGTFDKIINNIGLALRHQIRVSVRINTDANNFGDIEKLTDLFHKLGYTNNPLFSFHSAVLRFYDTTKHNKNIKYLSRDKFVAKHYAEDKEDIACQDFNLYKKFLFCLNEHKSLPIMAASCSAQYGSYLFDPNGDMYTCLETVGMPEHVIGTYGTEILKWTDARRFWFDRNISNSPNCKHCKYALFCGGGCLRQATLGKNGFGASKCTNYAFMLQNAAKKAYSTFLQNK